MIAAILTGLVKANVAAGFAILVVLAMRALVRPRFGALAAYLLWLAPLAAGLAVLIPHPAVRTVIAPMVLSAAAAVDEFVAAAPAGPSGGPDVASLLFGLWVLGAVAAATLLARRQAAFVAALGRLEPSAATGILRAQHSGVGPAVVGVFRPRIVAPADFETRFGADERALILAHERVHLRRGDAGVNALASAAQCLCWFNPLVHLAARALRIDQELACDATVVGRFPAERRIYAELLLKTQLAGQHLPLGCHWPAGSPHPLKARIAMLKSPLPEAAMRGMGLVVVGAVSLGAATLAWAAQPSHLEPADAAKLVGPGETILCKPDANRELHNCEIKGSPFTAIATPADVAREWPAQAEGQPGWVTLQCAPNLAAGRLEGCHGYHYGGAAERPELKAAFEQAAVRVISVIRLKSNPTAHDATLPKAGFYTIEFSAHPSLPGGPPASPPPTHFPDFLPGPPTKTSQAAPATVRRVPVVYAPPKAAAPDPEPTPTITQPIWVRKPTGEDIARLYPADAAKLGLSGRVTMTCHVDAAGGLKGCAVNRVDVEGDHLPAPGADPDFVGATLQLSKLFQMQPVSGDGVKAAGGVVRIPVRWIPPQPAPKS